jgi:hypothetical protein
MTFCVAEEEKSGKRKQKRKDEPEEGRNTYWFSLFTCRKQFE